MSVFFVNDTATTEIYTLSLHDALPILMEDPQVQEDERFVFLYQHDHPWHRYYRWRLYQLVAGSGEENVTRAQLFEKDRKSTRLNSSHANISYAVFCLKKKNCRH